MQISLNAVQNPDFLIAFNDFESFCNYYNSEEICALSLFKIKWPNGFRCSRCDCPHYSEISGRRLPLYQCSSCHKQNSLTVDTIMQMSTTLLQRWFQAIYLLSRPEGMNALQLSEKIHVTYKTAWLICMKIRKAMSQANSTQQLNGNVHVTHSVYSKYIDPTQVGWHKQEQPLFIGASLNEDMEFTRIAIEKVNKSATPNKYKAPDPSPFILNYVAPDSVAHTSVLGRLQNEHKLNLKRICWKATDWLARLFQGIGPKHLQQYLDQYSYMWNHTIENKRHYTVNRDRNIGALMSKNDNNISSSDYDCDVDTHNSDYDCDVDTHNSDYDSEVDTHNSDYNSISRLFNFKKIVNPRIFNTLLKDCVFGSLITYSELTGVIRVRSGRPSRIVTLTPVVVAS